MSKRSRGPDPSISDDELIDIVERSDHYWGRPFVTANEIAEQVNMSRQGVHRRLEKLHEKGDIRKYKAGRGVIWWIETGSKRTKLTTR